MFRMQLLTVVRLSALSTREALAVLYCPGGGGGGGGMTETVTAT